MTSYSLYELAAMFPHIDWHRPIQVDTPDGRFMVCRACIARRGLSAEDARDQAYATREAFDAHLEEAHA